MIASKLDILLEIVKTRFIPESIYPYWAISGVLLILAMLAQILVFRVKKHKWSQDISRSFIIAYMFLIYSYTVLSRGPVEGIYIILIPFRSYYQAIVQGSGEQTLWIAVNILMFVPIGFCLQGCSAKRISWKTVIVAAICFSYFIEFSQLLLKRGYFELFDDPFDNVLGALLGVRLFHDIHKIKKSGGFE